MEAFLKLTPLREWLYRLRRRYTRRPKKKIVYHPGLPSGLDHEVLDAVCKEHFGRQVKSVDYSHLSGWKSSGAYRLHVKTTSGSELYLIYKLANYEHTEIPALRDFPVHPGLPEYIVYSQPVEPLARYLPRIYRAEEVQPHVSYRYLLEDLHANYRIARTDDDRIQAAHLLPELHEALDAWAKQADTAGLLSYGKSFSEALQNYVLARLERYSQHNDGPALRSVLNGWSEIAKMHLSPEFFEEPQHPIHGDANFSNFHLGRRDPSRFKIVDWEWAGFGHLYADLAALLKTSQNHLEKPGYQKYVRRARPGQGLVSIESAAMNRRNWRQYTWSCLERAMNDAAFLSAQVLDASHEARINLPRSVDHSLQRILSYYRLLAD